MADGNPGASARLYVEPGSAPHTFDTSSESYEFLSESIGKRGSILDTNGIRGTRSHHAAMTRGGPAEVGGSLRMNVTPIMLDLWLPRILGSAESNDSFTLAETPAADFGLLVDRVEDTEEYTDCRVNRAIFRGSAGGLIELELEIFGKTAVAGTNAPVVALSVAANNAPYTFSDSTLTLASSSRQMMNFEVEINNFLDRRFTNSNAATSLRAQDRLVALRTTNPWNEDTDDLYGQANAGAAGTLVFTNTNLSTTFTFGTLQVPDSSPNVGGKNEIPLLLEMIARMTGSTRELVVTSDSVA
jgi:hypothetical protein